MEESDHIRPVAAYLGPEASFSHQAVFSALPRAEAVPLPSFKAILTAIQDSQPSDERRFDYAVLPVENSSNGSVVQALDLIAQCGLDSESSTYPHVQVVDENYLPVHHCLFVSRAWADQKLSAEELALLPLNLDTRSTTTSHNSSSLTNGTSTTDSVAQSHATSLADILSTLDIRTIYTHPQVWGQCNNILSAHLPPGRVDRVDVSSTSAAAAFVARTSTSPADGGIAAISSSLAGAKHPTTLLCIAQNIEDEPGSNTTRFLILQNRNRTEQRGHLLPFNSQATGPVQIKSMWTFTIAHSVPGTLATTLAVFAKHEFNLSAIQSRPRPKAKPKTNGGQPDSYRNHHDSRTAEGGGERKVIVHDVNWRYVFFVECLHLRDVSIQQQDEDLEMIGLLEELRSVTERVTLLGSWRDRLL